MLDDRFEQGVTVVEHVGEPSARALLPQFFEQRPPVGPRVAAHVMAVHPEHVEGDEGDGDRAVSVQHRFSDERPVRRAGLVEREFAVEHEPRR